MRPRGTVAQGRATRGSSRSATPRTPANGTTLVVQQNPALPPHLGWPLATQ
jgi:hypothetical protein